MNEPQNAAQINGPQVVGEPAQSILNALQERDHLRAELAAMTKNRNEFAVIVENRNRHELVPSEECECPCCNLHRKHKHELDAAKAELEKAQRQNAAMVTLLREVMQQHADPEAPEYNECEKSPCRWCDLVKSALSDNPDSGFVSKEELALIVAQLQIAIRIEFGCVPQRWQKLIGEFQSLIVKEGG